MAGAQLITIPFNEALRALEAENLPKKLYFLMGNDHFLQKFFIDKVYVKATGKSSVQKIYLIPDDISGKDIIDKLSTIDLFNTLKFRNFCTLGTQT